MKEPQYCRSRRIQRFVDHVPATLAACRRLHGTLYDNDESLSAAVERAVELSDASQRASVAHCREHYAYWGRADLGGDRRALRAHLERLDEPEVLEVYKCLCCAQFGAWRYTPGNIESAATIEALDGRDSTEPLSVIHATTVDSRPLRSGPALVAGWRVSVEGHEMLLLACEFEPRAARKLIDAAEQKSWGEGKDFRTKDYEADVLALLFEPHCVDVRRGDETDPSLGGRTFLSPIVNGWGWGVGAMQIASSIQKRLAERGLELRGESLPWHLAVAQAEATGEIERILAQLDDVRAETVNARFEPQHPLGSQTLERLFSSRALLEMAGLSTDGVLQEDAAYLELTLREVGGECSALFECGVDSDCTLERALRNTAQLSQEALDDLGDAIQLARSRVRWTSILRRWLSEDSPWAHPPDLIELLTGVALLFQADLWNVPVRQLADPQGGNWRRLERAFIEHGYRRSKLRVSDLFELAAALDDLPGVGQRTREQAAIGLATTLIDWPSGPRWHPMDASIDHAS